MGNNSLRLLYNVTHFTPYGQSMTGLKTATLNLRIDPGVKEALRIAAKQEHRSIANMVEVLIRAHCKEAGIPVPEQAQLFQDEENG